MVARGVLRRAGIRFPRDFRAAPWRMGAPRFMGVFWRNGALRLNDMPPPAAF
ncbi:hypothetical protein AX27061_3810 [Achromobacter xylosoxidans NBRC 15126 = ATCC 27061]|nr:hypothetical protein AX27061_3810 [Achromobacter xylosoxidans NBRC 15126 = ATCC 27061]